MYIVLIFSMLVYSLCLAHPSPILPLALLRLLRQLGRFFEIVVAPQWLQVGIVKAGALLLWIREIKRRARHDMIDVNVAVPRHALGEQPFNILAALVHTNTEERFRGRRLGIALEGVVYAGAQLV